METIRFALAVDHSNQFVSQHFGQAYKFLIYESNTEGIIFKKEISNYYRTYDEDHKHGSAIKAQNIIKTMMEENIKVLVSHQFGKNIKRISSHFIPVVVIQKNVNEVIGVLSKNLNWIIDELNTTRSSHHLLSIRNGMLKTAIQ